MEASAEAVEAIRVADLIVIGPGSLYTSLLPSLLVPGIRSALEARDGLRVYVCNVATQPGETEGYTLSEHLAALHAHDVGTLVDVVLANDDQRRPRAGGLPRGSRCASTCRPAARVRASCSPASWTRRTRTATTRGAWRTALVRLLDAHPRWRGPVAPVRSA